MALAFWARIRRTGQRIQPCSRRLFWWGLVTRPSHSCEHVSHLREALAFMFVVSGLWIFSTSQKRPLH